MSSNGSCSCPNKQTKKFLVVVSQTQLPAGRQPGESGESFSAQIVSEDKIPELTGNGSLFAGVFPSSPRALAVVEIPPVMATIFGALSPEAQKELCGLFAEVSGKVSHEVSVTAAAD